MDNTRLVLAFTAGMLATVNPCGLPMLPAYLGWFVTGDDGDDRPPALAVGRAVIVALAVTVGFMAVFGTLGAIVSSLASEVESYTPWVTVVVGIALLALGIALLLGRAVRLPVPAVRSDGRARGLGAMVLYGASYAVASVSCTLGVFVFQVANTFGTSWGTGLSLFAGYGLGVAVVLTALSVSVALARRSVGQFLRRASLIIDKVAGVLLVLTGTYLVWFAIYELRLSDGGEADPFVDRVTGWSADLTQAVQNIGGLELGLVLALVVSVTALVAVLRSGTRRGRS